jgi:hypothetical protein
MALESSDYRYARLHRVVVDCYCLQHPDQYCVSAKSLIAHICGLCIAQEPGSNQMAYKALQRSLNGNPVLEKASVPQWRGGLTIADVLASPDSKTYARIVDEWAKSVWQAYSPLQGIAHSLADTGNCYLITCTAAGARLRNHEPRWL